MGSNRVVPVIAVCVVTVLFIFFGGCASRSGEQDPGLISLVNTPAVGNNHTISVDSGSGQINPYNPPSSSEGALQAGEIPYTVRSDPFSGTCLDYVQYVTDTGVEKTGGDTKPDGLAITEFTLKLDETVVNIEQTNADQYTESGDLFYCPCSDTYYENIGTCNAHCMVTLGCFTDICANKGGTERTCLKGDVNFKISPTVKADVVVTVLDWIPEGGVSEKCKEAISKLRDRVMWHEKQHLKQMQDAISERVNEVKEATYNTGELFACGETEEEAKKEFIQEVSDYTKDFAMHELDRINDDYKAKEREFDENYPISLEVVLDCNVCASEG